jgi:hypothetical protein
MNIRKCLAWVVLAIPFSLVFVVLPIVLGHLWWVPFAVVGSVAAIVLCLWIFAWAVETVLGLL